MRAPSIKAIVTKLCSYRNYLRGDGECECECRCDCEYDIRLQLQADGNWALREGDASYDDDHSGYWGASAISRNATLKDLRWVAKDLVAQAVEDSAQGNVHFGRRPQPHHVVRLGQARVELTQARDGSWGGYVCAPGNAAWAFDGLVEPQAGPVTVRGLARAACDFGAHSTDASFAPPPELARAIARAIGDAAAES